MVEYIDTFYEYRCAACGKTGSIYNEYCKCDVCSVILCPDCNKNGLCPVHYLMISPQNQQQLDNISDYIQRRLGFDLLLLISCVIICNVFLPSWIIILLIICGLSILNKQDYSRYERMHNKYIRNTFSAIWDKLSKKGI
jgi:hypothetical protein